MKLFLFQVALVVIFVGFAAANTEFRLLEGTNCRALELGERVFDLRGHDSVFLVLDLRSIAPKVGAGYKNRDDKNGRKCLRRIESKLNATLADFRYKIDMHRRSKLALEVYVQDPDNREIKQEKRSAAGAAVALAILDLVVTGVTYVYTDYRINNLKERIYDLDEQINGLIAENGVMANNQNFIYKQNELMGIQKKVIVDYVNKIEYIHSCDLLYVDFENKMLRLELTLKRILNSITHGTLTDDLIDYQTLEQMTSDSRFHSTIYRVSAMEMYKLSKLYLHSVTADKITFILSFPVVSRSFSYKSVNVLSTNANFLHGTGRMPRYRFLIPKTMDLMSMNVSMIRDATNCLEIGGVMACQNDATLPNYAYNCVRDLLNGNVSNSCFGTTRQGAIILTYGKHGVLSQTRYMGTIYDSRTYEILWKLNRESCTYVPKDKNLVLESRGIGFELFQKRAVWDVDWKMKLEPRPEIDYIPRHGNLSLPEINNPYVFNDTTSLVSKRFLLTFMSKLSNPWVAVTIITLSLSILIACILITCCLPRFCKSSGINVNQNFGGHGIDGGNMMGGRV